MGKGSKAENELVKFGWKNDCAVLRSPGSGSVDRPSPDVILVKDRDMVAVELKCSSSGTAQFQQREVEELKRWSNRAGAKAFCGVKPDMRKFDNWFFIPLHSLHETKGGNYSIRLVDHERSYSREEILP